jgi:hypothetical protein
MKTSESNLRTKNQRIVGSVLVLAMVIVLIGGLAMTGWIVLLGARAHYTEQQGAAVQRRVAENNARALTRQYLLEKVIASSTGSGGTFYTGVGNATWGESSIPAWTEAAMSSTEFPAGNNLVSPASGYPYADVFLPSIWDGASRDSSNDPITITYKAYVNSRSPLLSGDLFVVHTSASPISVSGSLHVNGRSVIHGPGSPNTYAFTTEDFAVPAGTTGFALQNASATWLAGSNLPMVPTTAGPSGTNLGYDGNLAVVKNVDNPGNSLYHKLTGGSFNYIPVSGATSTNNRGVVSDGSGAVSITVNDDFMSNVIITDATAVTLVGQTGTDVTNADLLPGVMILVIQDSGAADLTTVTCQDENGRRLYLAIVKTTTTTPVQVTFTSGLASMNWRMGTTAEGTPIVLNKTVGGTLDLEGGIRTNASVTVASGTAVTLSKESDPKLINRLADRRAWVELYR